MELDPRRGPKGNGGRLLRCTLLFTLDGCLLKGGIGGVGGDEGEAAEILWELRDNGTPELGVSVEADIDKESVRFAVSV